MSSCHFVIGGVRSGKSRHAQTLAQDAERAGLSVAVLATALAADDEMRARIAAHRAQRPAGWITEEVSCDSGALAAAIDRHALAQRCVLIDCLTVWLSQLICPPPGVQPADDVDDAADRVVRALARAPGRVIVVSNEIGFGVTPVDAASRRVVDALGRLHQRVAALSATVTLMVAGLPLRVKP
jgi:adenosylcobinamide kinase / adenosylcobinamide-phosphate guanylyltransferase